MSERIVDNPANHGWVEENGKWVWQGMDDIAGIIISDTEPTDKVEGMQWLDNTTGKVWIWDGSAWFQFPQGKDGAPGKDGNIADATDQGVVATWDDTAQQWTPEGNLSFDANGRMHLGNEQINSHFYSNGAIISRRDIGNHFQAEFSDGTEGGTTGRNLIGAYNSDTGEYTARIGMNGNAWFNGNVEVGSNSPSSTFKVQTNLDRGVFIDGVQSQYAEIKSINPMGGDTLRQLRVSGLSVDICTGATSDTQGTSRLTIDTTGNATFSGMATSRDFKATRGDNTGAIYFGDGGSNYLYWNGNSFEFVGGNVSAPNITTRNDLIETLATLRASTLDETVDVRQALASACDKLIEKFTEMEKTATQGVEDDS